MGSHPREHAGDEGDAGHQDGAEPQPAGLERRFDDVHAFVLFLAGGLHDEDGVLAREADEHDQADLGEDVVVGALQHHADHRAEQAHPHDEEDGERQGEALVSRGEDEQHEEEAQREDVHRGVARDALSVGELGHLLRLGADLGWRARSRRSRGGSRPRSRAARPDEAGRGGQEILMSVDALPHGVLMCGCRRVAKASGAECRAGVRRDARRVSSRGCACRRHR